MAWPEAGHRKHDQFSADRFSDGSGWCLVCDHAQYRLPFAPSTAHAARSRLSWFLSERRFDQVVIDDALVVVSELVTNAVRHGRPDPDGTVGVEWYVRDGLHVLVHDSGRGEEPLRSRPFDGDALGGRGLSIVGALADRWYVRSDAGTTVHACIALQANGSD